jgi:hypothetical protein
MIDLRPGDRFVVKTKGFVANAIISIEHIISPDHEADMNHGGIIIDKEGNTFEALSKIDHYNIKQYIGCPMVISHNKFMTDERFLRGYKSILQYDGQKYPWWRLVLFILGLADDLHRINRPVCTELLRMFDNGSSIWLNEPWGTSPDNVHDQWNCDINEEIIFDGIFDGVYT